MLTSGNALRAIKEKLQPRIGEQRIAVIGKMTAQLVAEMGWPVNHVASGGVRFHY